MPSPELLLFSQPGLEQFKMFDALDASGAAVENREGLLKGKVALITGTRGIARATAEEFAREGAAMIFVTHTGTKQKRVDDLVASILGIGSSTEIIPVASDITSPEARQQLAEEIQARAGKLDVLYHNAAGGFGSNDPKAAERINAEAKVELTKDMADLLAASGNPTVLNIESTLSEYWGTDIKGIPAYDPVAKSKYQGKIELPRAIRELNQQLGININYATVCATGVDGTITWTMLKGRFKEQIQEMLAASEGGKATDTATVAQALLKLAVSNVPFGHTEYVGIPHLNEGEVKTALDLYDDGSRKIDRMVFPQPGLGFGHYFLKKHDLAPIFSEDAFTPEEKERLTLVGGLVSEYTGSRTSFVVTPAHTKGHFAGEGNPKFLPGYKMLAAAQEAIKKIYSSLSGHTYRLTSVRGINFARLVLPDDTIELFIDCPPVGESGYYILDAAVTFEVNGSPVATIDSMVFDEGYDPNDHLKPMVAEAAALTNGLHVLHQNPQEGVAPLFRGVKSIDYAEPEAFNMVLGEGAELITQSRVDARADSFVGQGVARIGSKRFATIEGLECDFKERDRAMALYNALVLRRQRQRERKTQREEN